MSMFRDKKLKETADKYCFSVEEQAAMARERSRLARNVLRDKPKNENQEDKHEPR